MTDTGTDTDTDTPISGLRAYTG
ncbi:predicted protein [Fibroporia radiculosa]|uniref:Uncharacterized protein n=1 Tax=Fibroporia radiculosa TaxID=599839 RepID=J7S692_9APHY|nr:predicted protein [Fibroporia radiculosa]